MTAGGTSSASWTTYFTPEATPVTLAQGEKLKVTWQFTLTNVGANNTSQNFRYAVVDTPSASRLAANGSPGTAAYTGYAMFANMSNTTLGNSSPFALRERVVASGASLGTAGDWGANGVANANLGQRSDQRRLRLHGRHALYRHHGVRAHRAGRADHQLVDRRRHAGR
jgi:hypothetical protein